jgi:hypothetical protein
MKKLITIFNASEYINKTNINTLFHKHMEFNDSSHNIEVTNIEILSKKLNNRNIIISSSTVTLNKTLLDLMTYLLFFDNLAFEVFLQIFNVYDYYIIACINMFMDKKYLAQLKEDINIEDVRKRGKLEQFFDLVLFQRNFTNIRKFLAKTVRNLEVLFEVNIDFFKNEYDSENFEITEFHLPKLNTQVIINDNNIYTCMIESIIMFESIYSIYKIIKRLKHFTQVINFNIENRTRFSEQDY